MGSPDSARSRLEESPQGLPKASCGAERGGGWLSGEPAAWLALPSGPPAPGVAPLCSGDRRGERWPGPLAPGSVCDATPLPGPRRGSHSPPRTLRGGDSAAPGSLWGGCDVLLTETRSASPGAGPATPGRCCPGAAPGAGHGRDRRVRAGRGARDARFGAAPKGAAARQAPREPAPAREATRAEATRAAAGGLGSRSEVSPAPPGRGLPGAHTLSPPARKRSTAAPLMPCRSQSPARTSLTDSPALTSTTQGVPSGSWMLQCLAALSLSGARVLQASDCGGTGAGVTGRVRGAAAGPHVRPGSTRRDKRGRPR